MNAQSYPRKVCLSGAEGKSGIFKTAASYFRQTELYNDKFCYNVKLRNGNDEEIELVDVMNIDDIHACNLSTEYRSAQLIILVYDPTEHNSLADLCEHYRSVIVPIAPHKRVILLRNNVNIKEHSIKNDEHFFFKTHNGALLGQNLTIQNTENSYKSYSVDSNNQRDVGRFFEQVIIDVFSSQNQIQCQATSFEILFCCCFQGCKDKVEYDYHEISG